MPTLVSDPTSSHAYGIGILSLLVAVGASIVFYQMFYLPESLERPSVSHEILEPTSVYAISMVDGSSIEGNENYIPNSASVTLTKDNHVVWTNDDSVAHTVTPDHRTMDAYSGSFGSDGVVMPGETYEFLFTEPMLIKYYCQPHPWMTGTLEIKASRGI